MVVEKSVDRAWHRRRAKVIGAAPRKRIASGASETVPKLVEPGLVPFREA